MQRAFRAMMVFTAFALCCAVTAAAVAQSPLDERIAAARRQLADNRFEQALADLDAIVRDDDTSATAHYLRGIALGSLNREREALDAFLHAVELSPGWADAHRLAALAALNIRNLPVAWDQAIKAHQAGADVSQSFSRLLALEKAPGDLDAQLAATRIYVMPLNTEQLAAEQDNPWGVDVVGGGGSGGIPDPFSTSATRATSQGKQKITESQSSFYNLQMQVRRSLANSRSFGLVQQPEMAQYLMVIEVAELDGGRLGGYIKLYDPRSGEEAYRRVLELSNINSLGDLNRDVERYVGYMEEWLSKRVG